MANENQHFVPQGYLRLFTIEGQRSLIWEYNKETGRIFKKPKSVARICSRPGYYGVKDADGQIDENTVEDFFSKIEDRAIRIIRKIKVLPHGKCVGLSDENREILSLYLALQMLRVPNFRDGIEEMFKRTVEIELNQIVAGQREAGDLPEFVTDEFLGDLNVVMEPWVSLDAVFKISEQLAGSIENKTWGFLTSADGEFFVASDNPIYYQQSSSIEDGKQYHIGPAHPMSELIVALRKDLALKIEPKYGPEEHAKYDLCFSKLDKETTRAVNERTIVSAMKYIYSCEKTDDLLELVRKHQASCLKLSVQSPRPRT